MNKKLILGLLTSIVLSVGYLTGNTNSINHSDSGLMQVGAGCIYGASVSEGGDAAAYGAGASIAISLGTSMIIGGAPNGWNPIGWGCMGVGAIL